MKLEEARRQAHTRGAELRLRFPTRSADEYDQVDVADLIYGVLDETHPVNEAPSQRYDYKRYEEWLGEQEAIRQSVWDAFDAGLHNRPLKALNIVHSASELVTQ